MVDPRTPVIVGVGQFTERIDLDGYRGMSSVELATEAAKAALRDCGADTAAVAQAIDTVAGTRQFEISGPRSATLGVSNNYPRSVARNVGAEPARAILEVIGGQSPQHLVTEFAGAIAAGEAEVVLLFGSENTSTLRHFSKRDDKPDHSETIDGQLEDRGYGYDGVFDEYTIKHGLIGAPVQYGLLENARRARQGLSVADYRQAMAELFAPFSKVAAKNPYSSAPVERSAQELATVTASNRMICDPYPRMMVARDQVNQGAATLLMSVEAARRLGVPEEKWVYLRGHADMKEIKLLERAELGYSEAAVIAVNEALRVAGIGLGDVAAFDLYSCFPFPVFNICDGTGLAPDDERGLTLTGGLPFFGGPGNNYSMHGIAEAVNEMRDKPGQFALVGGNGGIASKYSVGIYSTEPADWVVDGSAALQEEFNAQPRVVITEKADGPATIETYTVRYDWTPRTGIIIGRLDSDGSRFLATTTDEALVELLSDGEPLGASIIVQSGEKRNTATLA
ncbi:MULTISPECIES: acetyl-CoA acetyltransferase [unclassified Mycolicibacterium]|uniref:acetyl-CoA acetyltransferase n=1 Tax=unclassified Mycolicibacterium TaxID=2636767 RepID=UPI0012DC58B9|nr:MULTISPECIES: acetyl-CoA acetyltransferase [unclassified Mycolicibacterium]MUL85740.1 acetyl-CoA acetyltransferase [Mycolicibacterium sp. CBMA 329]MUL91617.1 acetyl-CoA acetyltransferase [Mycolicibacterium sp. CBMA 331]MUM02144.1 acetyl-CoA acetyltransferase [Mycolicibacterium sp. CBMA 334]MUM28836.1 acetyl-CoA acetyltransferase [Mycolicibacterium sp. CBMA 295]MUM41093.1 acetyl-CoA acetyltransferase [Mycolicibacterium sp. CBMA 247]